MLTKLTLTLAAISAINVAIFAVTGAEWIQIVTVITTCITAICTPLVVYYVATLKKQQDDAAAKQVLADAEIKKVAVQTNSMSTRLEELARLAGEATGAEKEKTRVTAEAALIALGTLAEKKKQDAAAPAAAVAPGVAENIEVVKDDVGIIKGDVKEVHTKVTKDVATGIKSVADKLKKAVAIVTKKKKK